MSKVKDVVCGEEIRINSNMRVWCPRKEGWGEQILPRDKNQN